MHLLRRAFVYGDHRRVAARRSRRNPREVKRGVPRNAFRQACRTIEHAEGMRANRASIILASRHVSSSRPPRIILASRHVPSSRRATCHPRVRHAEPDDRRAFKSLYHLPRPNHVRSATTAARSSNGTTSHATNPTHARRSDLPPLRSHSRHIAQTLTPPSVKVQQCPHTILRHEAHGPAEGRPQKAQGRGASPSSTD